MGVIILKQVYVYFRIEQNSEYTDLVGSQGSCSEKKELQTLSDERQGWYEIAISSSLSTGKAVMSHDTLVAMSTPSYQILRSNITPTKKNQGSLVKWLSPGLGLGKSKLSWPTLRHKNVPRYPVSHCPRRKKKEWQDILKKKKKSTEASLKELQSPNLGHSEHQNK